MSLAKRCWVGVAGWLLGCAACAPESAALRVANGADVEVLDPHQATGAPEGRVLQALFVGLTRLDPETLEVEPALATHWTRSDSGRHWHFHLRSHLRWSDGTPLRAADLRASWLRLLDPQTGAAYSDWLLPIRGAAAWRKALSSEAAPIVSTEPDAHCESHDAMTGPPGLYVDGESLHVELEHPVPFFAEMCAYHALAPVPPAMRQRTQAFVSTTVSNGAYRLVSRRLRDRVRVEKNPYYWEAASVALPSIDFLTIESPFTALNLFLAGEVDYLAAVPSMAVTALLHRELQGTSAPQRTDVDTPQPPQHKEFDPTPFLATYFYRLNVTRPPLDDVRVRRALNLAIDRRALVGILAGAQPAAESFVPPGIPGYSSRAKWRFDPAAARAELRAAGYPDGADFPTLELVYNSTELHRDVAEVLQHQWREVLGIRVRLSTQEWKVLLGAQRRLDYQMSRSTWIGDFADAANFLDIFHSESGNNRTGWKNSDYDDGLTRARFELDVGERRSMLQQAEALLLHEAPILPLFHYTNEELVSSRIAGFHRNLRGYVDWSRLSLRDSLEHGHKP